MNNWIAKTLITSSIVLFLLIFTVCTLKTDVSKRPEYKSDIGRCYRILKDQVLYKNNKGHLYLGHSFPIGEYLQFKSSQLSVDLSNKVKSDPLIKKLPNERVIALIPKETIFKIKEIFILENHSMGRSIQVIAILEDSTFPLIDVSNMFDIRGLNYVCDFSLITPIDCPIKSRQNAK